MHSWLAPSPRLQLGQKKTHGNTAGARPGPFVKRFARAGFALFSRRTDLR